MYCIPNAIEYCIRSSEFIEQSFLPLSVCSVSGNGSQTAPGRQLDYRDCSPDLSEAPEMVPPTGKHLHQNHAHRIQPNVNLFNSV